MCVCVHACVPACVAVAGVALDAAIFVEVLTPLFPSLFLPIAAVANIGTHVAMTGVGLQCAAPHVRPRPGLGAPSPQVCPCGVPLSACLQARTWRGCRHQPLVPAFTRCVCVCVCMCVCTAP